MVGGLHAAQDLVPLVLLASLCLRRVQTGRECTGRCLVGVDVFFKGFYTIGQASGLLLHGHTSVVFLLRIVGHLKIADQLVVGKPELAALQLLPGVGIAALLGRAAIEQRGFARDQCQVVRYSCKSIQPVCNR
jgi:hypothetical protein